MKEHYSAQQLQSLYTLRDDIQYIHKVVDAPTSMSYEQYLQLYTMCSLLNPDLIIELGRGNGNSTALFTLWANKCSAKVYSICNTDIWQQTTVPMLKQRYPNDWFANTEAVTVNSMITCNLKPVINSYNRILLFWDAHGYDTAEYVLGHILPLLTNKKHNVILHDITDLSYYKLPNYYDGQRLWRETNANVGNARLRLNNFDFFSEQFIAVFDFAYRNNIPLQSLESFFDSPELKETVTEATRLFGYNIYTECHMLMFSLPDNVPAHSFTFPHFNARSIINDGGVLNARDKHFAEYVTSPFVRSIAEHLQKLRNLIFRV